MNEVPGATASSRVTRGIVFAERPGFRPLELDLHHPAESVAPVILFVHGGGWRVGRRGVFCPGFDGDEAFEAMVRAGFAVASVDYRLSGEARFPAPRDDVADALAWLRTNGSDLGADADRVVLWGESAGATLAALVALAPGEPVRGVIDWYGPADLVLHGAADGTREGDLLGGTAAALAELAREASPAWQAHADAPPFLIAHGTVDRFVAFAQSERLAEALTAVGVDVEFTAVPGASHFWEGAPDKQALLDRAIAFAQECVA